MWSFNDTSTSKYIVSFISLTFHFCLCLFLDKCARLLLGSLHGYYCLDVQYDGILNFFAKLAMMNVMTFLNILVSLAFEIEILIRLRFCCLQS